MIIRPDHEKLQYSGRIDFDDPNAPVFVFAATYVKMAFTGTKVSVMMENHRAYWNNEMEVIKSTICFCA